MIIRTQGCWYALVAVVAATVTGVASAQVNSLERLVMPGPLAAAHANLEANCANCHKSFSRELQKSLCLDCHKDVANDITSSKGFHGKTANVAGAECASCHADHLGRGADILHLDRDKFDHNITGFPLRGKHTEIKCDDCHTQEKKSFHAAEPECNACHAKDDRHHGNLGVTCADCHAETSWKEVHFDHKANNDYALTGAHARITCVSCHVDEQYKDTAKTCIGCHAKDDHHKGTNGKECQQCHTTNNWKNCCSITSRRRVSRCAAATRGSSASRAMKATSSRRRRRRSASAAIARTTRTPASTAPSARRAIA